jgi:hypothetical protein
VFGDFLNQLLRKGTVELSAPPVLYESEYAAVTEQLMAAYAVHSLDVAGAPIPFDGSIAIAAARVIGMACWFLVSREESEEHVARSLILPDPRDTPHIHLSADLLLRLLPAMHRRARARAPDDVLTRELQKLSCQWPLSGVLVDVVEPPKTPVSFGGHSGLCLLYAERLVRNPRPAWILEGPARPYIDLVFAERGLAIPGETSEGVIV